MNEPTPPHNAYEEAIQSWARETPWVRRTGTRLGLQGKLVLAFGLLLMLGLGASTWVSVHFSHDQLRSVIVDQTQQLSTTLALAARHDLASNRLDALQRLADGVVRNQNVLFVGFVDREGRVVALSSRDLGLSPAEFKAIPRTTRELMRVRTARTQALGEYFEVVAPVIDTNPSPAVRSKPEDPQEVVDDLAAMGTAAGLATPNASFVGYVGIGMSDAHEQTELRQLYKLAFGVGCIVLALAFPLAYLLVHRVFVPIRQLVAATKKISAGDLETSVAIHRPDVIGDLARSFNEMVRWVKQQRECLAEANRDLEAKVVQRTEQLGMANQRLRQEIAEKEDFLRAVSHDLNAPLRNIGGMATLLLMKHRERFDEEVIHRIERIKKNVDVETDLIGELLELSRIKTRRQKMELVELTALIGEAAELFENDLHERTIDLAIETPMPVMWCERSRVRQIFQNLIDNACKYMGDGAKRHIGIGCRTGPNEAEFYISDTGQGIEPEDVEKIFFVFRRGRGQATQKVPGKGVGLASVKSIVETYGGRIWVESKLGQGTTFKFTINGQFVRGSLADVTPPACALAEGNDDSVDEEPSVLSGVAKETI